MTTYKVNYRYVPPLRHGLVLLYTYYVVTTNLHKAERTAWQSLEDDITSLLGEFSSEYVKRATVTSER